MTGDNPDHPDVVEEIAAGLRLAEAVNLHVVANRTGGARDRPGFIAARLSDGRTADSNVLYDTQADAIRHHLNDLNIFYVKVGRATMSLQEARVVLRFNRQARKNGVIFAEEQVVVPQLSELLRQSNAFQDRKRLRGDPE